MNTIKRFFFQFPSLNKFGLAFFQNSCLCRISRFIKILPEMTEPESEMKDIEVTTVWILRVVGGAFLTF